MCIDVLLDYGNEYCQIDRQQRAACLLRQKLHHKIIITQIAHFDHLLCTRRTSHKHKNRTLWQRRTTDGHVSFSVSFYAGASTAHLIMFAVCKCFISNNQWVHDDDDDASRTITTRMSISVLHTHMLAFAFLTRTLRRRSRLSIGRPSSGHSTRIRFCVLPLAIQQGVADTHAQKPRWSVDDARKCLLYERAMCLRWGGSARVFATQTVWRVQAQFVLRICMYP